MQGAEGRRLSDRAGQLEPGDDHDRPRSRRRHLYRADHAGDGRKDHRPRAGKWASDRRAAADDGRADRAQHRDGARPVGGSRALRHRADRRHRASDRQGRRPPIVPPGDGPDRPRHPREPARALAGRGVRRTRRDRVAGDHPAVLHPRRHRRRHRLQRAGVRGDRARRAAGLAHERGADRGIGAGLERVRDGGRARPRRQLHHRVLDREHRPDGGPYRRFGLRRPGIDPDRQGIPSDAQRRDRGLARDRRRHRRLERAVRGRPRGRPAGGHRDEPAGVALLGAGLEGDRVSDRQGRGQARCRLHPRRARQRDHPDHPGLVRADDRLRRHQDAALHLREIPGDRGAADDLDEIGRRGDGDRPQLCRNRCTRRCARWRPGSAASTRS